MTILRTKRGRVRNIRPEVLRAIHEGLLSDASARQVRAELEERYERGEFAAGAEIPSERTIVNIARDLRRDDSPAWQLEDAQPADVWPVLDTLLEVHVRSNGRVKALTQLEARLIANVRAANPKLTAWSAYSWVRLYLMRRNREGDVWAHIHDLAMDARDARPKPERRPAVTEEELGLIRKPGSIYPFAPEGTDR